MTMRILKICTRNAETYPQILGKLHGLDSFQTQKCNLHPKKHMFPVLRKVATLSINSINTQMNFRES